MSKRGRKIGSPYFWLLPSRASDSLRRLASCIFFYMQACTSKVGKASGSSLKFELEGSANALSYLKACERSIKISEMLFVIFSSIEGVAVYEKKGFDEEKVNSSALIRDGTVIGGDGRFKKIVSRIMLEDVKRVEGDVVESSW